MVRVGSLTIAVGGLALMSGCVVDSNGRMALVAPQVVVAPPVYVEPVPVVVEEPVMVPENYVIVNGEYVGVVGNQYFYLGAGGVWLVCDPVRVERFHGWERDHHDWREHAIRNDRFRKDARGHEAPRHDDRRVEPVHGDQHVQPVHGDQHVQPGHDERHVQPAQGTPAKAAPNSPPKKQDEKDTKDAH